MGKMTVAEALAIIRSDEEQREQLVKEYPFLATAKPRRLATIAYGLLDAETIDAMLRDTPARTKKQKSAPVEEIPVHQIPQGLFSQLQHLAKSIPQETKKRRSKKEATEASPVVKKRTVKKATPVLFAHREEVVDAAAEVAEESSEDWASLFQ